MASQGLTGLSETALHAARDAAEADARDSELAASGGGGGGGGGDARLRGLAQFGLVNIRGAPPHSPSQSRRASTKSAPDRSPRAAGHRSKLASAGALPTNAKLVELAVTLTCLAGPVNEAKRKAVLQVVKEHEHMQQAIVLRSVGGLLKFRGLVTVDAELKSGTRVFGEGFPLLVTEPMILTAYKYDSGARAFKPIEGSPHFGLTVEAVLLREKWDGAPQQRPASSPAGAARPPRKAKKPTVREAGGAVSRPDAFADVEGALAEISAVTEEAERARALAREQRRQRSAEREREREARREEAGAGAGAGAGAAEADEAEEEEEEEEEEEHEEQQPAEEDDSRQAYEYDDADATAQAAEEKSLADTLASASPPVSPAPSPPPPPPPQLPQPQEPQLRRRSVSESKATLASAAAAASAATGAAAGPSASSGAAPPIAAAADNKAASSPLSLLLWIALALFVLKLLSGGNARR